MEDDDGPRRQIYVRAKQGKPLQISLDDLLKFFEDAAVGKPTSVLNKWGEDPVDGRIYELALVTFKKNKAVQRALGLSGSYLGDREVVIAINNRPPKPRGQACSSCRVFVGNLPFDADDALLKQTFGACGRVLFVRFAVDETEKARGFCHVVFEDKDGKGLPALSAVALDGSEARHGIWVATG